MTVSVSMTSARNMMVFVRKFNLAFPFSPSTSAYYEFHNKSVAKTTAQSCEHPREDPEAAKN